MDTEIKIKRQRLSEYLTRHDLDGVLLTQRANFSWITCGKLNYIANNTADGVVSILATHDRCICIANSIEAPRMKEEELANCGIPTTVFPWHDAAVARQTVERAIGGRRIARDSESFGLALPMVPGDFAALRWSLTAEEIARYREGGRLASAAMERACHAIEPGDTEHVVAGRLTREIHAAGLNPLVTLVAGDQRIRAFRHPIPTGHRIQKHIMLVTCADFGGLISCLTRFVSFGFLPAEDQARHQAVCNIEAGVIAATRVGRTLGEIFVDLQACYAAAGFADQWQLHHQGGSTGYANREAVAIPHSPVRVASNQAFAWNPSVTGAKSEDTILVADGKVEVLTPCSESWPTLMARDPLRGGTSLRRPDVLVR